VVAASREVQATKSSNPSLLAWSVDARPEICIGAIPTERVASVRGEIVV
jgi:hypothetical protein